MPLLHLLSGQHVSRAALTQWTARVPLLHSLSGRHDARTPHEEGYLDVKLEGHGFALDEPELAEVVAVVAREEHVRVLKFTKPTELVHDLSEQINNRFSPRVPCLVHGKFLTGDS